MHERLSYRVSFKISLLDDIRFELNFSQTLSYTFRCGFKKRNVRKMIILLNFSSFPIFAKYYSLKYLRLYFLFSHFRVKWQNFSAIKKPFTSQVIYHMKTCFFLVLWKNWNDWKWSIPSHSCSKVTQWSIIDSFRT